MVTRRSCVHDLFLVDFLLCCYVWMGSLRILDVSGRDADAVKCNDVYPAYLEAFLGTPESGVKKRMLMKVIDWG